MKNGRTAEATRPSVYPITRLLGFPDYQLNRVTSWMMRLEFSCTPVMR